MTVKQRRKKDRDKKKLWRSNPDNAIKEREKAKIWQYNWKNSHGVKDVILEKDALRKTFERWGIDRETVDESKIELFRVYLSLRRQLRGM